MPETETHEALIAALGDTAAVARALGLSDSQVSNWKSRGIAWRFRPTIADMAKRAKVGLPAGFLDATKPGIAA